MINTIGYIVTIFTICACSLLAFIGVAWAIVGLVCMRTAGEFIEWIFQPWYVAGLVATAVIMTAFLTAIGGIKEK